jgi:WD40 repeat protein
MTIRVFISSTFRDMHAERDYLSRLVFPELRSRCQKRGAEFIGLDLRWGVTEEEAQREGALKICLDEIERCRPFFVCLLGSRYGWVPPPEEVPTKQFEDAVRGTPPIALDEWYALDETSVPPVYRLRRDRPIPEDVADTLARFWEKAGLPTAGESITAREILRGVFEEGFPATHVMFYLRKPGVEAAPAFPPTFVPVFVEPDANRRTKLHDLETKIRKCNDPMVVRDYGAAFAGLRIDPNLLPDDLSDEERTGIKDGAVAADRLDRFSAPVRQVILDRGTVELSGLETLGDQILEDLWTAIEKELERPGEVLDRHQRERAYHERFVIDRTRLFLGRDAIVTRVVDGLADPAGGNLMVVSGEPGSGKSALLAECARLARERFQSALVIPHFIGASPGSAILANTLRSICETLKRECGLTEEVPQEPGPDGQQRPPVIRPMEVPADPQKLLQKWPEFLEKAGAQKRVVLLLDALNQLDPLDHSRELGWVPYRIPQGVTMVVSALPGDCLDRLRHRVSGGAVIDVPVLAAPDRRAVVETHLGQRRKKLSPPQLERLLDTTKRLEAGRPLYLLVALEELGLFGSYEALDGRIDHLPPTVAELFDQVLERLEHDHGRDMTESICRWIAVSRSGMLESEILDLLTGREQVFPRARWSRFYHALESHLRPVEEETGEGLLAFYHDQLRFAVYRRYLQMQSAEEQPTDAFREAHAELARYFRKAAIEEGGEFPKWRWDQKRSLSELPHHQLSAEMWDALEKTLTDIGFVEAKSRTGMVYDLVRDYAAAERAWPGQQEERREEEEWQRRMQAYVDALIACSRAHTAQRGGLDVEIPPLPEPPPSVARTSEPEGADAGREWTPIERVRAWEHFVSNHSVALPSGREPAFLTAYNSVDSGPVADALEDRLRKGNGPAGWLRLTNRLPFFLRPACLRTLEGHTKAVHGVAMTPNGRRAVSGASDGTLRVWDLETGYSRVLEEHRGAVNAVAVTPDGRRAVSGASDGTLRVWDLETGYSRVLEGHRGAVRAVAVTPDGRRAVSGCGAVNVDARDETLCVWDLETGHCRVLEGHVEGANSVAMTPDGRRAISGGEKTWRVWDLDTGHSRVLGRSWGGEPVAITPDGRRAVSGGVNFDPGIRLCVWDLETGQSRGLQGHNRAAGTAVAVRAVAVTPDGRHAVSGCADKTLRVWDLETGHSRILDGHTNAVGAVAVTPDGRRAVSGSSDYTLRVWDLATGHSPELQGHRGAVRAVAVTPDGQRAVSGSSDGDMTLRVWDLATGRSRVLQEYGCTERIAVTPDGRSAISGGRGLYFWDLETGSPRVIDRVMLVNALAWTPDGRRAVSGSECLQVWDLETGHHRLLDGHTNAVAAIAVTPDGRRVVSGGRDQTLRVSDLGAGRTLEFLLHHLEVLQGVVLDHFSPGHSCMRHRRCFEFVERVMRSAALRILGHSAVIYGHTNAVTAVAVTPDGRCAVSGNADGTLRVCNLETRRSRVLKGHTVEVMAVAVTPDGRRAVSGSRDKTVRVWDLETGQSRVLEGHTDRINAVAVTPDGRRAVSGCELLGFESKDNTLRAWDLETGELIAIYASAAGRVSSFALKFPTLVAGTSNGRVEFLRLMGRQSPVLLDGPRIATAQRLWLCAPGLTGGRWDDAVTALCDTCGQRFPAPDAALDTIAAITRAARLDPADSPCLKLPADAWEDRRLLSQCPLCHEPLKFNPFVVDNRDRHPAP